MNYISISSRRFRAPVFAKLYAFLGVDDDLKAMQAAVAAIRYITRESDFRSTVCHLVEGIEARSEAKRLIVCDYEIAVKLKLAVMSCLQKNITSIVQARIEFEDYGLTRDDAWCYINAWLTNKSAMEKIRRSVAKINLPTPQEIEANAHAWIFSGTVLRSIRSLVRRKLSFVAGNYNVSLGDLEMDVLAAALEGFYLTIPFSMSEQHSKASAVQTAKNKINKIISHYQTAKRRQISRDDDTGQFSNSMVSFSFVTDDGSDIGENIIHSLMQPEEDPSQAITLFRTSMRSLVRREGDFKRKKALYLLQGRKCAKFLKVQGKALNTRFRSFEEAVDEVGTTKYFNMVRRYVGMSTVEFDEMIDNIRKAA